MLELEPEPERLTDRHGLQLTMLMKSKTIKDIQGNTQRSLTAELTVLRWLRIKFVKIQCSCLRAQHEVAFPD